MPTLTREQILNAQDYKTEEVDMVPFGWPGSVIIQTMTGLERGLFEKAMQEDANFPKFRALMILNCVVDGSGDKLFTEADVDALNSKSSAALDYLYDRAQALNKWRKKDVDALTKNSSTGQSEDSTSA